MSGPQFQSFYSLFGSCEISKLLIEYKAAAAAVGQDQIKQQTATAMDIQAIGLQAVKQLQTSSLQSMVPTCRWALGSLD